MFFELFSFSFLLAFRNIVEMVLTDISLCRFLFYLCVATVSFCINIRYVYVMWCNKIAWMEAKCCFFLHFFSFLALSLFIAFEPIRTDKWLKPKSLSQQWQLAIIHWATFIFRVTKNWKFFSICYKPID